MTAVVYRGPGDLRVEKVPVPEIGPEEILVRVGVCGVCPTDIKKIQHGTTEAPRIFGHETAGTIVKLGAQVREFRLGERVALHHHVPCRNCHACRHRAYAQCAGYRQTGITAGFEPAGGGYAEYVRVMASVLPGVVPIPAKNTLQEGAMLEPVNTVLKAVRRLDLVPGDSVLVIGQGPIGLMFTRLLSLNGARVMATDLFDNRLLHAQRLGAVWTGRGDDPELAAKLREKNRGDGLDAVVVAVPSNAAVQQGFECIRGGGKVLLFAHTKRGDNAGLDLSSICVDEKDLIGSYSADIDIQKQVARLVFSRALDVRDIVTHEYPLAKTADAVKLAAQPGPEALKVLVNHQLGAGSTPHVHEPFHHHDRAANRAVRLRKGQGAPASLPRPGWEP